MDQVEIPFTLRCPDHRGQFIGLLNVDPNAKKIGYCYGCIAQSAGDSALLKTLKTIPTYLEDSSNFYEKCRQRAQRAGEPPAEYVEELANKGERLGKLSKHIDEEKGKVKKSFEEIRKTVLEIIDKKEKECLELLDKEILDLSKAYRDYEKLITMGWPKQPDIQNMYPQTDVLVQRMSQIGSIDQLQAFMAGIQEDVRIQDLHFVEDDDFFKLKKKMDGLIRSFEIPEGSFLKIQSQILNSENLENLMKHLMKEFSQQEIQVENSIVSRMKVSTYESEIIFNDQFETLRDWLPKGYKFDLKLLFRGSVDGMSSQKFHEKCDGKGATITLVKCRFDGALGPHTLGGFLDQSWHSKNSYSSSREAFLFSLGEQQTTSNKCPILETQFKCAFYGNPQCGPVFGVGNDFFIHNGFEIGTINPMCYSNSIALRHGYGDKFKVEEIEVFQVQ